MDIYTKTCLDIRIYTCECGKVLKQIILWNRVSMSLCLSSREKPSGGLNNEHKSIFRCPIIPTLRASPPWGPKEAPKGPLGCRTEKSATPGGSKALVQPKSCLAPPIGPPTLRLAWQCRTLSGPCLRQVWPTRHPHERTRQCAGTQQ